MTAGGQLHQISEAIGELRGDARNAERSRAAIHSLLDDINKNLGAQNTHLAQLRADIEGVQDDVADLKPRVLKFEALQHKVAGGVTVLTLLAGGAGAAVAKMLPLMWK